MIATIGVVLSAAYMLWMYRRVIFGKIINKDLLGMNDLTKSEIIILWLLALPIVFYGSTPVLYLILLIVQSLVSWTYII